MTKFADTYPVRFESTNVETPHEPITRPKLLRRNDAAGYVVEEWGMPCSRSWLAKLAVVGGGPRFRKLGRYPLYAPLDLDEWVRSRMTKAVSSTAELA